MIPPIARRFVAGETEAEAVEHALGLEARGIGAMVNLLGEHYRDRAPADADVAVYRTLLADLAAAGLDPCISVKPSQIGLDVSEDVFRENATRLVEAAAPDGFVWFDMEDHTTVDATLDGFEEAAAIHPGGVGVCLQANLKRTRVDVERLASVPGSIRLVKGAYDPPAELAYTSRADVDETYRELLDYAFRERDGGIAVGSHDPAMLSRARRLHAEYGTEFEIQMLMGVRERAQEELADACTVRQYVPYGEKWVSYFYRRVAERKENLGFALRALAGSVAGTTT